MRPDLLIKALTGMTEPETTLQEFQSGAGIVSKSVAKSVIEFLILNGIGTITSPNNNQHANTNDLITFDATDRLYTAILALQLGCDIEQVSKFLAWKDFEKLASEVLTSLGYRTQTNLRLTKPRMEIDVVGTSSGFAIAVDCKHWKRSNNPSSIAAFARKQAARTQRLIKHDTKISQAVPVIMTLHAESVKFFGGVPVVPVHKFKSFVIEVKGFLSEIYVAR